MLAIAPGPIQSRNCGSWASAIALGVLICAVGAVWLINSWLGSGGTGNVHVRTPAPNVHVQAPSQAPSTAFPLLPAGDRPFQSGALSNPGGRKKDKGVAGSAAPVPALAARAAADAPRERPIRVGVIVSEFTATGPHWLAKPYGYDRQIGRARELKDPGIELVPVIEPGTDEGSLHAYLAYNFRDKTPLNGYDPAELKTLDVIMGNMVMNIHDEMTDALTTAVKGGLGYLQLSCGTVTPGYEASPVALLAGMRNDVYGWSPEVMECEVVAAHPLLGKLAGSAQATVMAKPFGHFGELTGVPLLRLKDPGQVRVEGQRAPAAEFYPLYISQLGRGRIVGISFDPYSRMPAQLQEANQNRFLIHCVQWLAGRPLN